MKKFVKSLSIAFILVLSISVFTACNNTSSAYNGTYEGTSQTINTYDGYQVTIELKNGSYTLNASRPDEATALKYPFGGAGTYKVKQDGTITFKNTQKDGIELKDAKLEGGTITARITYGTGGSVALAKKGEE